MKLASMTMMAVLAVMTAAAQNQVNDRKQNQQQRVGQGIQSGQLTSGETANLEKKETAINQEVHTDRTLNGGKLTQAEKNQVNRQQNQMSKQIYTDKHNAVKRPVPTTEVGARRENQQQRIAKGVASGQLKAGETARLEKGEAGISKEIHNDRAANGGKLTGAEKAQVNHQQNQESRKIYKAKHN